MQTGAVDAFGLSALAVGSLVAKAGPGAGVEATPSFGTVAGKSVAGYGAFGFRKGDGVLRDAFNAELRAFIGTQAYLDMSRPYGFGRRDLPDRTAADLCGAG